MKSVSREEYDRVVSELEDLKRKVDAMLPAELPLTVPAYDINKPRTVMDATSYDSEPDGMEE